MVSLQVFSLQLLCVVLLHVERHGVQLFELDGGHTLLPGQTAPPLGQITLPWQLAPAMQLLPVGHPTLVIQLLPDGQYEFVIQLL